MAEWNDLPTELKALVVQMVDDDDEVRLGEACAGDDSFDALLALSSMDRELRALAAPILWQTLDLFHRSLLRHHRFASDLSSRGHYVRTLHLFRPVNNTTFFPSVVEAYAEVLATTPHVESLRLRCFTSAVVTGLVPLLPTTFAFTLRRLELRAGFGDHVGFVEAVAAAALVYALPSLVVVQLSGFNQEDDGARLLVKALRQLRHLRELYIEVGKGIVHSSLTEGWSASLDALHLDDVNGNRQLPVPAFQALIQHHSSTLKKLTVPYYFDTNTFPQFGLPNLHHLVLWLDDTSASLALSFSASPLRRLQAQIIGESGDVREPINAMAQAVGQHRGTLEQVAVVVSAIELAGVEDVDAVVRLSELCDRNNTGFDYELTEP